jgi:enamine deaminase RidA (YjgF/YER057c/UK114 family)
VPVFRFSEEKKFMNSGYAAIGKLLGMVLAAAIFVASVGAQQSSSKRNAVPKGAAGDVRYLNPEGLVKNPRYTQVVEVKGGRLILISGQVATDASGKIVGAGDMRAQTKQVFENLQAALRAAGADLSNVIKLNSYLLDMSTNLGQYREVRQAYLSNVPQPPASTTVGVTSLVDREALLEVEAVAFLPMHR